MKISNPELKVIRFGADDVIATSVYWVPASAFNTATGSNFSDDYVMFNGFMTNYDSELNAYQIVNIHGASGADAGWKAFMTGGYDPETGVTLPPHGSGYDAFEYNGSLYTNGVSYSDRSSQ